MLTVLALNVIGDGVRDALDPRGQAARPPAAAEAGGMIAFTLRRLGSAILVMIALSTSSS